MDAIAEIHYFGSPSRNYHWVFEADITASFDEIDHMISLGKPYIGANIDTGWCMQAAGKPVQLLVGPEYNHFEIMETLANPHGLAGAAALAQMKLGPA